MKTEIYQTTVGNSEMSNAANSYEYAEAINTLGLKGQERFINPNNVDVFPFKVGTKEQLFVFKALFKESSSIENFDKELIPLEILEVYKKAKEWGKFSSFEIWSSESAVIKDPVLVGIIKEPVLKPDGTPYGWTNDTFYFLARWGEELATWGELKAVAIKNKIEECKQEAKDRIRQANDILNKISDITSGVSDFADMDVKLVDSL